jgi:hypothetical protein
MQGRLLQNAIRRLWGVLHERFAVHLTLSIACVALQLMYSANLNAQVELTATEGSTTGSYATLNEAFGAINAGTHKGAIAIVITANTTEPATPTPLLKSDGTVSDYTSITIKPGGAGEDVTINSAAAPAANRGVIEFAGADNVTIDGDDPATEGTRNLRIHAAVSSTTGIAAIRISSNSTTGEDGADNITIKNCIITGSLSNPISTSTLSYGIQFSNGTSTSSSSAGAYSNLNTLIENNLIERCYYGIHAIGASVSYPNTGLRIRNNSIGSSEQASSVAFRGIGVSYTSATAGATSAIIEGNDVRTGFPTAPSNMASIHVDAGNAGLSINGNYIHDSFNTSSSVWGMHGIGIYSAVSNASISITNNVIRDMRGYAVSSLGNQYGGIGIFVNAGATGLKIINNTIAQINSAIVGTCILINSADATVEKLVNNILHNSISNTNSCCLYINNPNNIINAQVDHNNYYVLPIGKIGYYTAARSTFDAWRTATGKDVNSFNTNPTFVSDTDLHLQPGALSYLESSGINVEELDTDFDGDSRPGPAGSIHGGGTGYDIGADEFDGIQVTCMPVGILSYTGVTNDGASFNWTAPASNPSPNYGWELRSSGAAGSGPDGLMASGETTLNNIVVPGIEVETNYVFYVRILCSDEDNSEWISQSIYTGHCFPTGGSGTYRITNVTTANGLTNINNTSVFSEGGYGEYMDQQVSVIPAASFNINITNAGGTCYFYVWVDWNGDYDFNDAGEAVIATTTYANNYAGTITLPGSVGAGSYRMRVAVSGSGAITSPCGPAPSGEFEDYMIEVVSLECYPPSNVTAQLQPPTSATISWNAALEQPEGYEWEVRTSGAAGSGTEGLFASGTTDIATLSAELTGLDASMTYHVYVRSLCADEATSPWTSSSFYNGACVPTGGSGSYRITNVTTSNGLTNINNTSVFSEGGYGDYTEQQVLSVIPAASFNINITNAGGTCYFYVWIDWNGDYDFNDAGEAVIATTTYANNYAGTITIPGSVTAGSYRMRVGLSGSGAITSPCGPAPSGEFEDYMIEVVSLECYPPSNVTAQLQPPTSATISWNAALEQPEGYGWEVRTSGAAGSGTEGLFASGTTDIATLSAELTGLDASMTYHVYVRSLCADEATSPWTSSSFYNGACIPTGLGTTYRITNVNTEEAIININNTSVLSPGGYADYTSQSVIVLPAASFDINITNAGGTCYFYVWVDWNGDYDFNDAGEAIIATTSYANNYSGTINVPGTVAPGAYRMRVAVSGSGAITSPCGPAPSGEFEDYMVIVISGDCYPPSNITTQLLPPTSATISWEVGLEEPESYEWEVRTEGAAGSGTEGLFASGTTDVATLSAELTGLAPNLTYQVYVRSICADDATSPWTSASFYNGACTPTGGSGTYRITNVSTAQGLNNINNTSAFSTGGYADYTSQQVMVLPAATFNINITNAGGTCYFYVWADWNGDYDFNDAGEAIIATTSYANNFAGTITVPSSVLPGSYTMRVAVSGSGAITSPCGPAPNGEFEDYTIQVISVDCYPPSNITTQLLPPTSATISWAAGLEEPESYEWEVRTEGAAGSGAEGLFASGTTDLATLSAELTGLAPSVTYQVYVRSICADDATSPWTSTSFYNGTCIPTGGSGTYRITNVTTSNGLTNLNNASVFSTGGYGDYTEQQVDVLPAGSFNINITNAGGTCYFYVWADWNNDYDFNDAGEAIIATTSYANNYAGTITIPGSVLPGSYRMRVAVSGSGAITSPCGPAPNGEFEDYTIHVIELDCYPPANITTQLFPPTSATINWDAALEDPESYEWEVRTGGEAGSGAEGLFASGTTDLITLSAELTGLTPSETYYVYVRSICADDATSPWTSASFYNGACIPTGLGTNYRITNVTTSNALENINNTSVLSPGGYADYTEQQVDVLPAGNFNINITNAGGTCYFYVWADWNNDYDFNDAGEAIIATTTYANNFAGSITVPGNVAPGSYRMRVAVSGSGAITSPCGPSPGGEFEDYTIHVVELDCYPPANVTAQLLPPTSATISWNAALEEPESYEWEVRTSGAAGSGAEGLFASGTTDVATLSAALTDLEPNVTYHVYVRSICSDDETSPWTSSSFYNGLCVPTGGSGNYRITNVTTEDGLNNINNTSTFSTGGYGDYTEQQVEVMPASSFDINITNAGGTCYFYVWADWNNDYDFTDAGEAIIATTSYANNFSGTITVPNTVAPGSYRMRVAVSGSGAITSPCGPAPNGEFEDYTVVVVSTDDCYPPVGITVPTVNATNATIVWSVPVFGEPIDYEYVVSPNPAEPTEAGTSTGGALTVTVEGLIPLTQYYVFVRAICEDDNLSGWVGPVQFATPLLAGCDDPTACNYDPNVNINDGSCVYEPSTWYLDADGDGFGAAADSLVACAQPEGYVTNNTDCDDNDETVWQSGSFFADADGDGYDAGTETVCYGDTIPAGYVETTLGTDCDDQDENAWQSASLYIDADGDGYDSGTETVCYGDNIPTGYSDATLGNDCNDDDAESWGPEEVEVSLVLAVNEVCHNSAPFTLTGGTPAGGTWSSTSAGLSGSTFSPGVAGEGNHTIVYTVAADGVCSLGGSASATITVNICPGVDEESINEIVLYPTYTNGNVTIVGTDLKEAVIMGLNGQVINTVSLFNTSVISMQEYSAGIYFVRVVGENKVKTFKVVKVN